MLRRFRLPKFSVDRPFLIATIVLVVAGFFIFTSAALGLLARDTVTFSSVAFSQFFFGIVGGTIALITASLIPYRRLKPYAIHIFAATVILTLFVFIPGLGFEHNGARRWLSLGSFTFQPAELLKLGTVIAAAAWFAQVGRRTRTYRYGLLPFLVGIGIVGLVLLAQPDTGTFLVIAAAAAAVYFVAGARARDIGISALVGAVLTGLLILARPYLWERIRAFLDPTIDPLGASYQIQQSLIAIGSGGFFGRGFGQSIQKFNYLPEPMGDSIFAVAAEEFGFLGCTLLIALFLFLALRGLHIATRAPDQFSRLLVVGIVILIVAQSFINMASMLGVFPLTGLPLLFVSHGGSALLVTLAEVGIILNVSRYMKQPDKKQG
jgi:cell division protein FtsW